MPLTLSQTVAPTEEPLELLEVKTHLRISVNDDDQLILAIIKSVRDILERTMRRQFVTATYTLSLDEFPSANVSSGFSAGRFITLPRPPLQSVTSIVYFDSDNVLQTLATTVYGVDTKSEPGRIYLKSGQSWPSTYDVPGAVTITYKAGWTSANLIPPSILSAMYLYIGHLYEHREAAISLHVPQEIPFGLKTLIWLNRVPEVY